MFVAIEGIDASGKNTQSKLLANTLDAKLCSFPDYDTRSGQVVDAHLKQEWRAVVGHPEHAIARTPDGAPIEMPVNGRGVWADEKYLDAFVFQALQLMNRMEHACDIHEAIHKNGQSIVSDRYTASAMVYGGQDGLDMDYLIDIHRYLPQPDVWVLVDIDVETSIQRRPERRDRYESNMEFLEKVADGYRRLFTEMAAREGPKWQAVDGRRSVGDVHLAILEAIDSCGPMR